MGVWLPSPLTPSGQLSCYIWTWRTQHILYEQPQLHWNAGDGPQWNNSFRRSLSHLTQLQKPPEPKTKWQQLTLPESARTPPSPPHRVHSTLFLPSRPSDLLYLESLHSTPPPPRLFFSRKKASEALKSLYESPLQTLLLSTWAVGRARERLAGNAQVSWVCPHPLEGHCYSYLQVLPTPGVLCASRCPFPAAPNSILIHVHVSRISHGAPAGERSTCLTGFGDGTLDLAPHLWNKVLWNSSPSSCNPRLHTPLLFSHPSSLSPQGPRHVGCSATIETSSDHQLRCSLLLLLWVRRYDPHPPGRCWLPPQWAEESHPLF